jgi:ubiquinone/menaquinone biosynthesis C-methylase UbiE
MKMPAQLSNQYVYQDLHVVAEYCSQDYLEKPEAVVIERLRDRLADMRMLDIAVGGGRTTHYFAPLVKEYVGIDYSEEMIAACRRRFWQQAQSLRFLTCDMRRLDIFEDHCFDFVLISFNAISAISHEDRLQTFADIHRVCKAGGYLLFSAHNLQSAHRLFALKNSLRPLLPLHPKIIYWNLRRWFLRRFIYNPITIMSDLRRNEYAVFNDGAHDFRLQHYYVRPAEQLRQLERFFTDIQVFAQSGAEIDRAALAGAEDGWLFYFCVNR